MLIVRTPDHPAKPRSYVRKFFSETELRMFLAPRALMNKVVLDMLEQLGVPADAGEYGSDGS